jgi:hypothetical protein
MNICLDGLHMIKRESTLGYHADEDMLIDHRNFKGCVIVLMSYTNEGN